MKLSFRRRRRQVRHVVLLPTLITLGNGICGFASLLKAGEGKFDEAAWLVLFGMLFDALDGRVARMTGAASTFGAQMDSLCDLISFGVAPAFLVKCLILEGPSALHTAMDPRLVWVACVFYAMCALIRLARFTVESTPDETSHQMFAGLPTPAAAGVVVSIVLASTPPSARFLQSVLPEVGTMSRNTFPLTIFVLGLLMTSRIPYVHVMNRLFRGVSSFVTLVEILLVGVLLVLVQELAPVLVFVGYACSGPLVSLRARLGGARPSVESSAVAADEDTETF